MRISVSRKQTVGSELFGDDLTGRLKVVTESKTTYRPQEESTIKIISIWRA